MVYFLSQNMASGRTLKKVINHVLLPVAKSTENINQAGSAGRNGGQVHWQLSTVQAPGNKQTL